MEAKRYWVSDQHNLLTVLLHNLKNAWPTKIFEFIEHLSLRYMHYLKKKNLGNSDTGDNKHANIKFWR